MPTIYQVLCFALLVKCKSNILLMPIHGRDRHVFNLVLMKSDGDSFHDAGAQKEEKSPVSWWSSRVLPMM